MNISYNWLKDLIETELSAEEMAAELTRVGLAVEGIHPHGEDHVLDIDLTSNRPDCLSHFGVARELAVSTGSRIRQTAADSVGPEASGSLVTIEDSDLCNRFTARVIRNVKVGPSPRWLVNRLEAIGERSINNVADITNYVMHELGQPMHAFDLDNLTGGKIIVRRAKAGEAIQTLDEVERKLDQSMLVVCDAEKPAAIGGIMGGLGSSITEDTVNVLLEVAYFDRANIRSTSRKLSLATEASYRFERGTDIINLVKASERASDLICELAGGVKADFVDVFPVKSKTREFGSRDISGSVRRLTGLEVASEDCIRILNNLGIGTTEIGDGGIVVTAPSWRHDIAIEEDLVEEIARHAGYEKISDHLPPAFGAGEYQPSERRERALRSTLAGLGHIEALSYSFIDQRHDEAFEIVPGVIDQTLSESFITLRDSVIEGALRMRPSILPGLLDSIRTNLNHKRRDLKLFEIGKIFAAKAGEDGLPNEQKVLSIALTGNETFCGRSKPGKPMDFYDLKGSLEAALDAIGCVDHGFAPSNARHLQPGQAASVLVGALEVGHLGRLNDKIAAAYKFKQPVYVAEINLSQVLSIAENAVIYRPLPRFPSIVRDVSFVVSKTIAFATVRSTILDQGMELCRSVSFVDNFEAGDGSRSLTIRLEYRSDERTLIEDEVEAIHETLLKAVEEKLQVKRQS